MYFLLQGYFLQFFFPSRVDPSRNSATLIDNIFTSHSPNLKFSSGLVFTDLSDHFPIYLSLSVPKTEITVDEKGKSSFRTFTDKEISNLIHVFRVMIGLVFLKLMMLIVQLDYFCVVWELCWISIFLLEISQGILHPNAHGCLEV